MGAGGGGNKEWNLAVLMGSEVSDCGSGRDSISVSFSSGIVVKREAGRSAGEQATIAWRRCVFNAKKERFSNLGVSHMSHFMMDTCTYP